MTQPATFRPADESLHAPVRHSGARILIVDDEYAIRLALAKFLRSRGFVVEMAESARQALEQLASQRFDLMLCDVRMPEMSGLELVPQALHLDPDMATMMLSAVNDAQTAREALTDGACDYLMKPIELSDLGAAVGRALHRRLLDMERRRVEGVIREEVAARTAELEEEKQALRDLSVGIAEALTNAMEAKDQYLRGHSQRVADLAASVADTMGLDADTVESVRLAARVMDVGKIGIRESVLNKPGALTPEEFAHVKDHVRIGMEILSPLRSLGPALQFVHDHHERLDGRGYPRGLRGDEISVGGRILAAADAFCALTSRRAFREPLTPSAAMDVLRQQVGDFLDPKVCESLMRVVRRRSSLVFIEAQE